MTIYASSPSQAEITGDRLIPISSIDVGPRLRKLHQSSLGQLTGNILAHGLRTRFRWSKLHRAMTVLRGIGFLPVTTGWKPTRGSVARESQRVSTSWTTPNGSSGKLTRTSVAPS